MEIEQMPTSENGQVDAVAQAARDQKGARLPWYAPATWRNTTPVDTVAGEIGVGFDCGDGGKVRLRLDLTSAARLAGSLTEALSVASVDLIRDAILNVDVAASRFTAGGDELAPSSSVGQGKVSQQQEAADRAALALILEQVILKYIDVDFDNLEIIAAVAGGAFWSGRNGYNSRSLQRLPTDPEHATVSAGDSR